MQARVALIPVTVESLEAELAYNLDGLAEILAATVGEWPPTGGEWDRAALEFFRAAMDSEGFDPRWGPSYAVADGKLVGAAGFFGAPDPHGEVEIGYSVCLSERRKGIATAAIALLCSLAAGQGASSVRARTSADNHASLGALRRNRFVESSRSSGDDGAIEVTLRRAPASAEEG